MPETKPESRPEEITAAFYAELDKHLAELEAGNLGEKEGELVEVDSEKR